MELSTNAPALVSAGRLNYSAFVKFRCCPRSCLSVIGLVLLLAFVAGDTFAKPIRLRHQIVSPEGASAASASAKAAPSQPVSGLFLIQFHDALQPEWRAEVEALGVDLLRYVPENAFVARVETMPLAQMEALPFVAWVGEYRPEYKVLGELPVAAMAQRDGEDSLRVTVLMAPRAPAAEMAEARGLFTAIQQQSVLRAGTVLRGTVSAARLDALARSHSVLWIEPARDMRLLDEVSSKIVAGDGGPRTLQTMALGYDGAGVTVAVADSGLDSGDIDFMHPDLAGRVTALFHYGTPGQLEDAADEHSHGTHVAGIIAGNGILGETDENGFLYGLGVAPGASLIGQRIFDAIGNYAPPPSFETLTRDATRAGADIGSNSWGDDTQGRYDVTAMEFDELVRDADALTFGDQPYILEFSAGNAGPNYRTIGTPAVAKNVIATGASQNDRFNLPLDEFAFYDEGGDAMADFSSRGPCEDGRIKPDVVAPGTWIASLRSVYANDNYAWWPISGNYMYQGGTSQAGPHVSGAAAVFVQFYRQHHGATPSPALVKAALINSAADLDDGFSTDAIPNNDEGWGRVDLPALVGSERDYAFVDQSALLTHGAIFEHRTLIGSRDEPLRVTLTYTDVPAFPAAVVALVNDLDLEVVSPSGQVYRGNRFADGESIADAPGTDTINNVEAVHIFEPVPGEYIIRVRGTRVVEDARRDTVAVDQDFALVISGAFGAPGVGIATLDRAAYRAPDQIRLTLVDYDLAGQSSVNVTVRSTLEPAGELVALTAHGVTGLFTGAVATATGPAQPDGALQIAHGNLIEVLYADAAPPATRIFTAIADLQPPVISDVRGTNQFGQTLALWNTDEAARSFVYYGDSALDQGLTNLAFGMTHEFTLLNIPPGAAIQFMAVAEDVAGNRSTNDNNGALFFVTNTHAPTVLLLDSYADNGFIATPPLSGYTAALNAVGVSYNVFDARSGAEPTLAQLQSHQCVIWRTDELASPPPSLANKIVDYVNSGGSLLIASMEAVTRFTEAGLGSFNTTILQLHSYTEDQPVDEIAGAPAEPIGAGIDTLLDYSPYAELMTFLEFFGVTDPSDWIVPGTNASAILLSDGAIVGARSPRTGVDLPGRTVYLSFPLDAVPLGSGVGNNRAGLLRNILNFLAPPANTSAITLDSDVYSLPGRAVVEVEDADIGGQGSTTATVRSPGRTNELALTLFETARRGLFRGSVVFVPTESSVPGTFFAQPDETVQFDYFDASAGSTLSVSATIDTNAPAISDVFVEPGYLEALVYWTTDKPADALVQYSESPDSFPINFIAFDPVMTTEHEIFISGLKPETTYYLRVTSRDRAGNTVTDDNNGQFYTFTTLQPRLPPWFDDIETPSVEWTVISPSESESEWMRGTPGGGESAYSGENCWGSNLGGGPVSLMESYLISPGVLLTGGNRATLRFQHNYDFFPYGEFEFQLAGVFIITNVTTSPVLLEQMFEDASGGWEEFEFDLTPYMGHVVYIVWYHFLFSFDGAPRLGWLVDDVSITVDTVTPGTVQITNNIWQAVFALSGPTGRLGTGRWTVITNAPPGEYVVQFGDVPHYTTPAPQTNTLNAGGVATFSGNYTFADANSNGIPDSWELQHFGVIDPQRTSSTDSNGDGVTDYAKFVTGTDPNNPLPPFPLLATRLANGQVQLSWKSVTNHLYRIHGSADLESWSPYTVFLPATGSNTTITLPSPTNGAPNLFRVEAAPGPNAQPAFLRLSASLLSNNAVRLDWPASIGRGYRVLGSTNATTWTPVSDWIRPSGSSTNFTLPAPTNGAPHLFRLEVAP